MKKVMLKLGLPMAAITLAVAGAFASQTANTHADAVVVKGHLEVSCTETDIDCTTDDSGVICTNGSDNLFRLDNMATSCPNVLYQIPPN